MSEGRNRGNVQYAFPSNLRLSDVRLVYLDLNHWISLSKVISGHKDGLRYKTAFDACVASVNEGKTEFPLSLSILMEIQAIHNRNQRLWLRRVTEQLSRFQAVLPRTVVASLEFDQVLGTRFGRSHIQTSRLDYIGFGVGWAFGQRLEPSVVDSQGRDVTTEAFASMPLERRLLFTDESISYILTRMVIEGPVSPSDEAALRAHGWNPEGVRDLFDSRVKLEGRLVIDLNESASRTSLDWRKGRLRDVISAREFYEYNSVFRGILDEQQLTVEDVFDMSGTAKARRHNRQITDVMPTFDVAVTLKTAYHRNPNHRWKRNDLFDIDAMSSVLPYCDIVVTDKEMASHINQTKLSARLGTVVLSTLDDLVDQLTAS